MELELGCSECFPRKEEQRNGMLECRPAGAIEQLWLRYAAGKIRESNGHCDARNMCANACMEADDLSSHCTCSVRSRVGEGVYGRGWVFPVLVPATSDGKCYRMRLCHGCMLTVRFP